MTADEQTDLVVEDIAPTEISAPAPLIAVAVTSPSPLPVTVCVD